MNVIMNDGGFALPSLRYHANLGTKCLHRAHNLYSSLFVMFFYYSIHLPRYLDKVIYELLFLVIIEPHLPLRLYLFRGVITAVDYTLIH